MSLYSTRLLLFFKTSDGPGSKFFDPGWVGSAIFGIGLRFRKFPPKLSNFSIFSPSGRVKKYPSQRWVGLSFTAGQKYAWVGLGLGPSLFKTALRASHPEEVASSSVYCNDGPQILKHLFAYTPL